LNADGEDVAVVTVETLDKDGNAVPVASNQVQFDLTGPGRILGVGNGDPTCHEADRVTETVSQVALGELRMKDGPFSGEPPVAAGVDASHWPVLFSGRPDDEGNVSHDTPKDRVVRGSFDLPRLKDYTEIVLHPKALVDAQAVYVNGHLVAEKIGRDDAGKAYPLSKDILKEGRNSYAVVGKELLRRHKWEELNQDPGSIRTVVPADGWKRSLFSGKAQVIVQTAKKAGELTLKVSSPGLAPAVLKLDAKAVPLRPAVPE
jgi:beta-galactosidase